jgi:hypothetical protein
MQSDRNLQQCAEILFILTGRVKIGKNPRLSRKIARKCAAYIFLSDRQQFLYEPTYERYVCFNVDFSQPMIRSIIVDGWNNNGSL